MNVVCDVWMAHRVDSTLLSGLWSDLKIVKYMRVI